MEEEKFIRPDFIFEVSWEVCNKVGGIHTVIATKTLSLVREWEDHYILIGPDIWKGTGEHPEFQEDTELFKTWKLAAAKKGIKIRAGRWKITGNPIVVLVDYTGLFLEKNEIFKDLWQNFGVDSLNGGWDYIEPALFGYAAGRVIECFYQCHLTLSDQIVAQFHEWLTAGGVLYIESRVPQIATIFTAHATVLGRTISGNGLPFYNEFLKYDVEAESKKWNVVSKHTLEKAGAKYSDCFTTVSSVTARECQQFLKTMPDVITPNGFDDTIVPQSYQLKQKRLAARHKLLQVASALTGEVKPDSLLVIKSGRYEFRNKGIDVFIKALNESKESENLQKDIIGFIFVPAHHTGPRLELKINIEKKISTGLDSGRTLTHHLQGIEFDKIVGLLKKLGIENNPGDKVKIIFVPVYLDGNDGIFNLDYYNLLPGFDLSIFPSYYEPWGYTPLESLAFHVPTITSDVAGFGQFIKKFNTGVFVIHRDDQNQEQVIEDISEIILKISKESESNLTALREAAFSLSREALWKNLISNYWKAYSFGLQKTKERKHLFEHGLEVLPLQPELVPVSLSNEPIRRKIFVKPVFPAELKSLETLSQNLWWSWNPTAIALFEKVDVDLWEKKGKNPIAMLAALSFERVQQLKKDVSFIAELKKVSEKFDAYMVQPVEATPGVAYFCMEYGLESNLKTYSGGLGILAGDYLKEASDSAKNVVAIGLLYRKGYLKQKISPYGDQLAEEDTQKFTQLPLEPVKDSEGEWVKVSLGFPGRTLYAKAWRVPVGRVSLYLLDTDIPENSPADRSITSYLYAGNEEDRLKQELLLGIGGVRLLNTLKINPNIYHCNEGHTAFLGVERIYHAILEENISYKEALSMVRSSTLFTSHTPESAGHDSFKEELLRVYLSQYTQVLNISWEEFMGLGRINVQDNQEHFSMTYLGARISQEINGVSFMHEKVSKKLFRGLWTGFELNEIPIGHVTNAVHYPSWASPGWQQLYEEELGWKGENHKEIAWQNITKVTDSKIWEAHIQAKKKLLKTIEEKLKTDLLLHQEYRKQILQSLKTMSEDTFLIGFARRFTAYKRPTLLFHDLERLKKIVNNDKVPVIIIFSGKAHPNDKIGQTLLKEVLSVSSSPDFIGKIIFLEDYNMGVSLQLVQGVDLWLNTPERGREASGTSGMKAVFNGVLNFSTLDGWWKEAFNFDVGWGLKNNIYKDAQYTNEVDARNIYQVLETEIIPTFYERKENLPVKWISKMKAAFLKMAPVYNTGRMIDEYYQKFYFPLFRRSEILKQNNFHKLRELSAWQEKIIKIWPNIKVHSLTIEKSSNESIMLGDYFTAKVQLNLDGLSPEEIAIEILFFEKKEGEISEDIVFSQPLNLDEQGKETSIFSCRIQMNFPGVYNYSLRVRPQHGLLPHSTELPIITWL